MRDLCTYGCTIVVCDPPAQAQGVAAGGPLGQARQLPLLRPHQGGGAGDFNRLRFGDTCMRQLIKAELVSLLLCCCCRIWCCHPCFRHTSTPSRRCWGARHASATFSHSSRAACSTTSPSTAGACASFSTSTAVSHSSHAIARAPLLTQTLVAGMNAGENDWWGKHKIYIGDQTPPGESGSYSQLLASSTFCFAIMGDGFSSRFEDGLLHG